MKIQYNMISIIPSLLKGYLYLDSSARSMWTLFSSLPLMRRVSLQNRRLLYVIFLLLIYKVVFGMGSYLLMNELERAVQQFYTPSGGLGGGFNPPPGPSGNSEIIAAASGADSRIQVQEEENLNDFWDELERKNEKEQKEWKELLSSKEWRSTEKHFALCEKKKSTKLSKKRYLYIMRRSFPFM